jgi:flagellar protein FlbD
MIRLTRLNHVPLVLNSDLIEHIEVTPDTVISLTNGQKIMVLETAEQVVERVIEFRRTILHSPLEPANADTAIQSEGG